jgi:hypothetical protein
MKKICLALCTTALLFAAGCSSVENDVKDAEKTVEKDVESSEQTAEEESANITNVSDEENEISTIMASLKNKGYTTKNNADIDDLINLSNLESVTEMEKGDSECTIYQFYTKDETDETFDSIVKHLKEDKEGTITEKDNMITETDDDKESESYIKKNRLIVKTENISDAQDLFKEWKLTE